MLTKSSGNLQVNWMDGELTKLPTTKSTPVERKLVKTEVCKRITRKAFQFYFQHVKLKFKTCKKKKKIILISST